MKQNGEKAATFVECLSKMRNSHKDSGSLASFLDYTCEWIKTVNRGPRGLHEINDDIYLLVKEIETTMQAEIIDHLKNSTVNSLGSSKETTV